MKLCDQLYEELIKDTSTKGELFNDLLDILNDEPAPCTAQTHDDWELRVLKQITLIKSLVILDEDS